MTPTTLAAALLRDVPRYGLTGYDAATEPAKEGGIVFLSDVLTALTAAMDPAIAERAGDVVAALRDGFPTKQGFSGYYPDVATAVSTMAAADNLITDLLAQNAALRAERDDAVIKRAAWELEAKTQKARAEAADAVAEKLREVALQQPIKRTGK